MADSAHQPESDPVSSKPGSNTTEQIFDRWIAEDPSAEQHDVGELCDAHPERTARLRRLWTHYDAARRLFEELAPGTRLDELVEVVRKLAREETLFEPQREIGRGGMCIVEEIHEARLGRRLARKRLPIPLRGRRLTGHELRRLARFVLEARIASRLHHPAIPQVFEFGLGEQDQPFLVLPLVEGVDFAEIVSRVRRGDRAWPLSRALSVLGTVCGAIAHAHSVGILHRDLKPENIMVGRFGETMVLDWGLAKPIGSHEAGPGDALDELLDATRTADGDIVGTPPYMAPEHACGNALLTPASDQYQIGAVLYTLLSGRRPYEDATGTTTARAVVAAVVAGPPSPLRTIAPDAPPELVAICERAMIRDPALRYASVEHLAADLRAFLDVRVVDAYETGAVATLRKWIARNRGFAAAVGSALGVVLLSLITVLAIERRWSRDLAETNVGLRTANQQAADRLAALEGELYVNDLAGVQAGMSDGQRTSELRGLLDRSPERLRGLEWRWLQAQLDTSAASYAGNGPYHLLLAPSQDRFVTLARDGALRLWQIQPPQLVAERALAGVGLPMAWRADGGEILCVSGGRATRVQVPTFEATMSFEVGRTPGLARYSPDGGRLFLGGRWPTLDVVDTATGAGIGEIPLGEADTSSIEIDATRGRIATGSWNGEVHVFDLATYALQRVFRLDSSYGTRVSFADDGTLQVLTSRGAVVRFDVDSGQIRDQVLLVPGDVVTCQAIDPGGAWHVHGRGAALHLTDLATNRTVVSGNAHDAVVGSVTFVPRLGGLLSLAGDGEARFWHWRAGQMRQRIEVGRVISHLALLRDSRHVVLTGLGTGIGIVDLDAPESVLWIGLPSRRHNVFALSPDETRAAVCGAECPLYIVDLARGSKLQIELPQAPGCVAWTTGGIVVGMPAGKSLAELDHEGALIRTRGLGFEPSWIANRGDLLAVGGRGGEIGLFDSAGPVWLQRGSDSVYQVRFSGDGSEIACALASGAVDIRWTDDGHLTHRLLGHQKNINGILSTADRWITASADRSLRIWRRSDGRELMKLVPDDWFLSGIAVDEREGLVITGGEGRALHTWRIPE